MFRRLSVAASLAVLTVAGRAAAERELDVAAPARAAAGSDFVVAVHAATHVGGGERIGFFHAEFSTDGGRTWRGLAYDQNQGPAVDRRFTLQGGAPGTWIDLRFRVAFRDGAAGDVDYAGAAIRWTDTWEDWSEPPARHVRVAIGPP